MNDKIDCRYCLSDENPEQLIDPCKCEGSMRFVHQKCLEDWIINGNRSNSQQIDRTNNTFYMKCEICGFQMKYTKEYQNGIFKSFLESIKLIFRSWRRSANLVIHSIVLYYLNKRIILFINECMNILKHSFNSESAMELIHNITVFVSIIVALTELFNYYRKIFSKMRKCSMIFAKRIKE